MLRANLTLAALAAAASTLLLRAAPPPAPGNPIRPTKARKGAPGPSQPAGTKLARMAREHRIGLTNITRQH